MSVFIPNCIPNIGKEEIENVNDCLNEGMLTFGKYIKQFE